MLGYALFIYVTVVLYVANLSAILLLKPSEKAMISSLSDLPRLGSKLCLLESLSSALAYKVPTRNQHR
jgi:hypothetical protein